MANEQHLEILKQGVTAWNQWRKENPEIWIDLRNSDLSGANLFGADLREVNLGNANLSLAELIRSDLSRARLYGANLTTADLSDVNLSEASLDEAMFLQANLHHSDLYGADLTGADLTETRIGYSSFSNIDLSRVAGLESVIHKAPSSIGVDTLTRTLRGSGGRFTHEQIIFFENAGVPAALLEYLPGILETDPLQFYACFISYSTRDEEFAEQLNQDLNQAGIKTWKWDRDAVRGRDLGENIDMAIRTHDKTILVCSVNSLTSPQVEREIQLALDKEIQSKTANTERRKEALAPGREAAHGGR